MIRLYQFKPAFGLPNASPFCMKVETYLRMAELPYECPRGASLTQAPKGKMPYIEDGDQRVADSSFIVDYLNAFVANLLWVPIASPLRVHAQTFPNLEAYCQRMKARYYAK